ncbi:cysteine and tyrosine-rich protein 1-like [Dreissena polymorpha]|uniref:Uncharacterized protein n=1 Tax=Dreissena polymorpha TaxID=45954 RepID=A0A9D4L7A9_DREPO|nr:cysteine and tyrosine-rich protein 1-like [Dreissena polymorpha]KAH3852573.1 hypothetical protein DPMN_095084 [Dreissena polymorpha]
MDFLFRSLATLVVCLTLCFKEVAASEVCWTGGLKLEDCKWGCCDGSDGYSTCCEQTNAGLIAGAVLGSLVLVAIVVSIVVCCVCCVRRSPGASGQVLGNATPVQAAVVTSSNMTYGQPQPYPMQTTQMASVSAPPLQSSGVHTGSKMGSEPPPYLMQPSSYPPPRY